MSEDSPADVTSLTVQLLSAYLSNNTVASSDLAELIATTRTALSEPTDTALPVTEETFEPAVSVRKSLSSRDHIISLIDGKPYKMLKRHLLGHGLTPAEYRTRYNLPPNYPMVALAYSDQRREVAKATGLGRKTAESVTTPPVETQPPSDTEAASSKRTRKTNAEPTASPEPQAISATPNVTKPKPAKAKAALKGLTSPDTAAETAPAAPKQGRKAKTQSTGQAAVLKADRSEAKTKRVQDTASDVADLRETAKPARAKRMARAKATTNDGKPQEAGTKD